MGDLSSFFVFGGLAGGFQTLGCNGLGEAQGSKALSLFEAQLLLGVSKARLELGIEVGGLRSLGQA